MSVKSLTKTAEIFFAVMFGGILSYFITKFYETLSLEYGILLINFGVFVLIFLYVWYSHLEKRKNS